MREEWRVYTHTLAHTHPPTHTHTHTGGGVSGDEGDTHCHTHTHTHTLTHTVTHTHTQDQLIYFFRLFSTSSLAPLPLLNSLEVMEVVACIRSDEFAVIARAVARHMQRFCGDTSLLHGINGCRDKSNKTSLCRELEGVGGGW